MMLDKGTYAVPMGHVATVVTKLEMTAPTMSQRLPFPKGITVAKEDLTLADFRDLFRKIGAPWLWTSGLADSDDDVSAMLQDPSVDYWVVRQGANAIGLVELDFRQKNSCELVLFGMVASMTGKGLGQPMMALAQSEAFARDITRLRVSTCHLDSPHALPFYIKAGFTPIKRMVEVFPDPRLHGHHSPETAPQIPCLT